MALDLEAILEDDRWIRNLACRLVGDADGEDVAQKTWLAFFEKAPPGLRNVRAWLRTVACNFGRRHQREVIRRRERERAAARPESVSSEEAMERAELRRHVLDAVLSLGEPYRSTMVLRFFEELSLERVAEAQQVPLGTVKTRVARALRLLRGRLRAVYGDDRSWAVLFLPLLPLNMRAALTWGAGSGAVVPAKVGAAGAGIILMSSKAIFISAVLAIVALTSGFVILLSHPQGPRETDAPPAARPTRETESAGDGVVAADAVPERAVPRVENVPTGTGPQTSSASDLPGAQPPTRDEVTAGDDGVAQPEGAPAKALLELKQAFGEGGGDGWKKVGEKMGTMRELLLRSPEDLDEFLSLIDRETDASFLESVLHHLPLGDTDAAAGITASQDLQEELWSRFEGADDARRRLAFLRFFAFQPNLSSSRMDDFVALASTEASAAVRQISIDAISSNRKLIPETWETLATVAESDPDPACRETAIEGLAHADSEQARAVIASAFRSPDEGMRAAALRSQAGGQIPDTVSGGDTTAYLVREFRTARTLSYKKALVERLLQNAPGVLKEEISRALPKETNSDVKREYRHALEKIEEVTSRARESASKTGS
jgi:RNA polymerase sigma-70 factor (ECF subfamily)